MSYCGKCGEKVAANTTFCPKCGERINEEETGTQQQNIILTNFKEKVTELKVSKRNIIVVVVAFIILIAVASLWKNAKKKVDLNECIAVEFSGYDTVGTASANINENQFISAIQKAQGKKISNTNDYSIEDLASNFASYQLEDSIKMNVTPSEGLKNGDEVTLKITFDENVAKENGIKFIAKEQKIKVNGLDELQEIDPFSDLEVTFSGIAPNVTVSINNKSHNDYLSYMDYTVDKSEKINIGDTITIHADIDANDALQNGYIFTSTSKEYTCENVDRYITNCTDIQNDTLAKMQKEAIDNLDAYFANATDEISNSDWNYEGIYLLTAKSISDWNTNSYIYIVYSSTISSIDNSFEPTVVYFPIEYSELIQTSDGTQTINLNSPNIKGRTDLNFEWWNYVPGYTDGSSMFHDIIVANKGNYTYDISEDLQKFSN